ncbi:MAG: phage holin family protein [Bacteroidales bacterium]|nr:phage holin family protein [Bacteroidales bacterium]
MNLIDKLTQRSPRNARTAKDLRTYLSQRYDLLKLELLEKSSQLLSVVLSMLIVVVCALAVLIYLSNALISWLTIALNAGWAYTIVCAIFVLIIIIVIYNKDALFVKPLIRKFSQILYSEKDEVSDEEIVVEEEGGLHE